MTTHNRLWTVLLIAVIALFGLSSASAQTASNAITVDNAAQVTELAQLKGHTGPVFSLAFSPDSKSLASGGSGTDYTVVLWDVATAAKRATLEGHTAQIAAVGFNADGTQVLSASYDKTIRTWDTTTGGALETIDKTDADLPFFIADLRTFFSADGSVLTYTGGSGVQVMDLATHHEATPTDPLATIESIAISADGKTLAWVDDQAIIHLVDVATAEETASLTPSETTQYGGPLVFSADGKMLAFANYDTANIQLWNLETKEAGPLLTGHTPNTDGTLGIYGLAFNPDGTLLASASYDNTTRIWDTAAGKQLISLDDNGAAVVTFSPDGTLLASSDVDGTIHLWSVPAS